MWESAWWLCGQQTRKGEGQWGGRDGRAVVEWEGIGGRWLWKMRKVGQWEGERKGVARRHQYMYTHSLALVEKYAVCHWLQDQYTQAWQGELTQMGKTIQDTLKET